MDFIGKEAILRSRQSINRNDHYSVYIIDWLLPDMNGIEVARRIRQEAFKSSMSGHIAKPIDIDNLMETLETILNKI